MKQKLLNLFLLTIVFVIKSYAQCSFTATATSTESRCKESGTITITATPSGGYTYQIISGPVTSGPSSVVTFSSLPAGNYVVATTLGGCTVNTNVAVAGTYQEPGLLSAVVKNIACPSGTGCITANQPTNGRTPYRYALITGPTTRPLQPNRDFCGLPAGAYTLQALDSCGVVRTTNYTVAYDTGTFVAYTYGYDLRHANCTDLIVCPLTGFSGTTSHSLMKVWYVKPNGDTLKVNQLESPVLCDTLVGESHTYGTWKMLGYDSCGRVVSSTFSHAAPNLSYEYLGSTCAGVDLRIANSWKYGLTVTYKVRKCSDNSLVFNSTQTSPTTYYSSTFTLQNDTCYKFEHYNECGDTVRTTYTAPAKPVFNINACEGTACKDNGKGSIRVNQDYLSGTVPVVFKIIDGPEGIGMTATQPPFSSYVYLRDLALGTYKIEGTDACGQKDTVIITLNKPLQRTIEVTQTPNCSGGANVHLKITSNFGTCSYAATSPGNIVRFDASSPSYNAINISTINPTSTTPGVWEGDLVNVVPGNLYFQTYAPNDGCVFDTTIVIQPYIAPVLNNVTGYVCTATGIGTVNYTLNGGKPSFQYRIRPQGTSTWTAWQNNTTFSGVTAGVYDINVEDACPNGSITSFSFNPWNKSGITVSSPCPTIGQPFTLTANPNVNGVNYDWIFNGNVVGSGSTYTIPNYQFMNNGTYRLRQTFPGGTCIDTASKTVLDCITLPLGIDELKGSHINNNTLVKLSWSSLSNDAGNSYKIYKSINGQSFNIIGEVLSNNNSNGGNYSYTDNQPNDVALYKVYAVDKNNKGLFTNTIRVAKINQSDVDVKVSPNPFVNNLSIQVKANTSGNSLITLLDVTGKKVFQKQVQLLIGNNVVVIDEELSKLNSGVYLLNINNKNGEIKKTIKVIKN